MRFINPGAEQLTGTLVKIERSTFKVSWQVDLETCLTEVESRSGRHDTDGIIVSSDWLFIQQHFLGPKMYVQLPWYGNTHLHKHPRGCELTPAF